ncbi:IS1595 family transposase [Dechloromonas denitrificans]|uniref:IS1595 family transposase n=1 Tax=Dechloromonas denitrificans TaxID=281362 RepID=UPI0009F90197|nr:IS1595 family transposase [Dechloromonas denitrificans]
MAQHFSQSKEFRNLTLPKIQELSEQESWECFVKLRWGNLTTMPCPSCGTVDKHYPRRARKQWCCRSCSKVFSVTTDTPFLDRKLPFKQLLLLIYLFVAAPKGLAANQVLALMGVTFRTAYQNLGKIREAIFETQDCSAMSGVVQIDGGHFCGKPRRPRRRNHMSSEIANHRLRNRKASIAPPKASYSIEPWNAEKLKKRRIVLVLRQLSNITSRGATRTIIAVIPAEDQKNAIPIIQKLVRRESTIQTDDGRAFSSLTAWYEHQTVRHSAEYCTDDGVNNNQAESYFSRMRRAEYGVHHGMRPQYLAFFATEFAWREDSRKMPLREKFIGLIEKLFQCDVSRAWRGYAQGHRLGFEYMDYS